MYSCNQFVPLWKRLYNYLFISSITIKKKKILHEDFTKNLLTYFFSMEVVLTFYFYFYINVNILLFDVFFLLFFQFPGPAELQKGTWLRKTPMISQEMKKKYLFTHVYNNIVPTATKMSFTVQQYDFTSLFTCPHIETW